MIGLILAGFVNLAGQYSAYQLGYSFFTFSHLPMVLLLPFFVAIFLPNLLLKRWQPAYALRASEILVIFSLGLIAATVPHWGMATYFMGIVASPHYFATPENQWYRFIPYLPEWTVVQNQGQALDWFFGGLPSGQHIPWGVWLQPLWWWFSFFAAIFAVGVGLIVILRKQWVEHERLTFPLARVPLLMVEETRGRFLWPAFVRSRIFQIGFAVTLLVMLWNCATYWRLLPRFPIMAADVMSLSFGRAFPNIPIRLNLFVFSLSFFINVDILLSVWLFQIAGVVEEGVLNRLGIFAKSSSAVPGGLVSVQFIGGLIFFVLWGLWMARHHLRQVFRKAFGRTSALDDSEELISYRTAVWCLILGLVYLTFWLTRAGMSFSVTVLLLALLFIFYLATCRIVAETGLVMLDLPINAHQFTIAMIGSANLSLPNLTVLGMGSAYARNWRTFTQIALSHITKLRDYIWPERKHLLRWACVAFALGVFVSIFYTIYAGYTMGGAWNFRQSLPGVGFWDLVMQWINNPQRITKLEAIFLLTGIGLNALLTAARYAFPWWRLHPIGFVVGASGPVRGAILPLFLAWLIQIILLRLGGIHLYRRAQPLFIGILLGYVIGTGLSVLVDVIWFPGSSHELHAF